MPPRLTWNSVRGRAYSDWKQDVREHQFVFAISTLAIAALFGVLVYTASDIAKGLWTGATTLLLQWLLLFLKSLIRAPFRLYRDLIQTLESERDELRANLVVMRAAEDARNAPTTEALNCLNSLQIAYMRESDHSAFGKSSVFLEVRHGGPTTQLMVHVVDAEWAESRHEWPVRWEGSNLEAKEMVAGATARLHLCDVDAVNRRGPGKPWQPGMCMFHSVPSDVPVWLGKGLGGTHELVRRDIRIKLKIIASPTGVATTKHFLFGINGDLTIRCVEDAQVLSTNSSVVQTS